MCKKKIESFDTMKPYRNGFSTAEADLRWEICGVPLDIYFNTNGVRNKIDSDVVNVDEDTRKGTRKPSTRAERRKETATAKNRRKRLGNYSLNYIMPNSGKVKDTGLKPYFKGDKVYKRTHNYMWCEDTRETKTVIPFWEEADDKYQWSVGNYAHFLAESKADPKEKTEAQSQKTPPETFMDLYIVSHSFIYDYDYVTKEYVVMGYNNAKDFYHKIFCAEDDDVALFTTKVNENGIIVTDKLIMPNDEDED